MKRWRRWLFNIAAGVSLAGCLLFLGLWVATQWRLMGVQWVDGNNTNASQMRLLVTLLWAEPGRIEFSYRVDTYADPGDIALIAPSLARSTRLQFGTASNTSGQSPLMEQIKFEVKRLPLTILPPPSKRAIEYWQVFVPDWFPVLAFAVLSGVWLRRFRQAEDPFNHNLCVACGYDLRATPDRCPECGTIPTGKEKVST